MISMNINAVKAYSQAAGARPSLPERRREAITDAFDIELEIREKKESTKEIKNSVTNQQTNMRSNSFFTKHYLQDFVQKEQFEVFTNKGAVRKDEYTKGTIFDGRA